MRFETTFLPLRTSTTSSMGISTRPILSCRLKAATRLSRLALTFFSKPEYVWMMYHCMPIDFRSPLCAKPLEYVRHAHLHQFVHYRQEHSKKRYRRDDHPGRRNHVFAARPRYLLHLHANVVQKLARVSDRSLNFFRQLRACSAPRFIPPHFPPPHSHKPPFPSPFSPLPQPP